MNHLQNSNLIAAAVGLTVGVVSAATIFIYHKILENQKQRTGGNVNLDVVNRKIAELQAEVEAIRLQQSQLKKRRKGKARRFASNDSTYTATDNDTDVDAFSTTGTDAGDDEFYDCSDSESAAGENDVGISEETNQLAIILTEIDKRMEEEFDIQMYYKLQTLAKTQSDNVEVIWRFARYCYKYTRSTSDANVKKDKISEGITACERLLHVRNANLYKWYAILIGVQTDHVSTADKIKCGHRFREYVEMALEMIPDDPQIYHLLGRFQYEVASLSWVERKLAKTLFGDPPSASYEEALTSFLRMEELLANMENRLYLSKTYIALGSYEKAVEWLEKLLEMPVSTMEEQDIVNEGTTLLNKYSGYRL